jgi:hypothetical protein
VLATRLEAADMIRSGWNHRFVAVLIGIALGLGGLAGQAPAQAAAGPGVNSEGGYSERRPCGDCYDRRERACDDRQSAPRRCPDCYDRQPRCGDCGRDEQRPCDQCADRASRNRPEDRCAESKKACEPRGERRDDDDDDDRYDRKKKDRSVLHKVLRGVFD